MSRQQLRPWVRWMPLWMLKIVFVVSILLILLPVAIWGAVRDAFRELRRDYRDMVSAATEEDQP